jgi:hypothetical protein
VRAEGTSELAFSEPLMHGDAGANANGADVGEANSILISKDLLLFGYDQDSIYVLRKDAKSAQLLFHPAEKGLKVTDLGDGKALLWMENARKGYVIDASARPSSLE